MNKISDFLSGKNQKEQEKLSLEISVLKNQKKYFWLPILISVIALIISIISLFK